MALTRGRVRGGRLASHADLVMAGTAPEPDEVARDRRALETILGLEVGAEPWPDEALPPGCRVRVIRDPDGDGPWAAVFTGTVDTVRPPHLINNPQARAGEFAYFVKFDFPQFDGAGDGPYRKAQIWDRYLEPL